jgi:hypothetical protein
MKYMKYSSLLVINDEYIIKKCIDNKSMQIFTREKLITDKVLIIDINTGFNRNGKGNIGYNTDVLNSFNDLINSMDVHSYHNYIEETGPNLYNGLICSVLVIRFIQQCIIVIHKIIFKGLLTNLKKIFFENNDQIKKIEFQKFNHNYGVFFFNFFVIVLYLKFADSRYTISIL